MYGHESEGVMSEMVNMDVNTDGTIRARRGFKTFAGMVWQLWLINRRFTKMGIKGDFTVRLPLPEGNFKTRYETDLKRFDR